MSYTFTDAKFKSSFDSDFSPWGNVSINDELPYIPNNIVNARLGIEKGKIKSYLRLKHVDKTRTIAGHGSLTQMNSTDALNILDLVAKYQLSANLSVDFKVYNLTDSKVIVSSRPAGYRPNMPRHFITAMHFDF